MTMTPSVQDPSGLLERVPELEALCALTGVRKAVEAGKPRAAYRALHWARLLGRVPRDLRPVADALLSRRRPFVEPLKRPPTMTTINGMGSKPYGNAEDEGDGAYILTNYLVLLFVPILPLGSYLVRPAENGWYFLGRVPLGRVATTWTRGVGALLAVAVVAGLASAAFSATHGRIHVVNATPSVLRVTIGDESVDVAPGQQPPPVIELRAGAYDGTTALPDGRVLESRRIDVVPGSGVAIWNPLGAALLSRFDVVYAAGAPPIEPALTCGETFVTLGPADHVFEEPPVSLQVREGGSITRTCIAAGRDAGECLGHLASSNDPARAVDVANALSAAFPGSREIAEQGAGFARFAKRSEAALEIVRRTRDALPSDVEAHKLYQAVMTDAGRKAEALAEYEARAAREPDSPDAAYLAYRLMPLPQARIRATSVVQAHPDHVHTMKWMAWEAYVGRRWESAVERIAAVQDKAADARVNFVHMGARALVAAGRPSEALSYVAAQAGALPPDQRGPIIVLHSRIARLVEGADVLEAWRRLPPDRRWSEAMQEIQAHREPTSPLAPEEAQAPHVRIVLTALRDPEAALGEVADVAAALRLDPETAALLYAEAIRRGAVPPDPLRGAMRRDAADIEAMEHFVRTGEELPELAEIDPELMASIRFVRSRVTTLPETQRRALAEEALRDDLLHDTATIAAQSWPPPA